MKYTLHQHEILLLRLAEHFGEVVPSGDLAVALGYLPEERNPLRAQARIARRCRRRWISARMAMAIVSWWLRAMRATAPIAARRFPSPCGGSGEARRSSTARRTAKVGSAVA